LLLLVVFLFHLLQLLLLMLLNLLLPLVVGRLLLHFLVLLNLFLLELLALLILLLAQVLELLLLPLLDLRIDGRPRRWRAIVEGPSIVQPVGVGVSLVCVWGPASIGIRLNLRRLRSHRGPIGILRLRLWRLLTDRPIVPIIHFALPLGRQVRWLGWGRNSDVRPL